MNRRSSFDDDRRRRRRREPRVQFVPAEEISSRGRRDWRACRLRCGCAAFVDRTYRGDLARLETLRDHLIRHLESLMRDHRLLSDERDDPSRGELRSLLLGSDLPQVDPEIQPSVHGERVDFEEVVFDDLPNIQRRSPRRRTRGRTDGPTGRRRLRRSPSPIRCPRCKTPLINRDGAFCPSCSRRY